MSTLLILIGFVLIFLFIRMAVKSITNSRPSFDDRHFKQAGVEVIFGEAVIIIKGHRYTVDQITGISTEQNARGSMAWKAIIDVDDLKKPRHTMLFISRSKADEFTNRLSTALRKAGGPSFV